MTVAPVLLPTNGNDDARAAAGALRALPFEALALDRRPVQHVATSSPWSWVPLAAREWRGFTATLEESDTAGRSILLRPPSGTPVRLRMPTRGGLRPCRRDEEGVESDVELGMILRSWARAAGVAVPWNPDGSDHDARSLRRLTLLLAAVAPKPAEEGGILTVTAPSPWTALGAEAFSSRPSKGMLLWSRDLLDAASAALAIRPVATVTGRVVSESRLEGPSEGVLDVRLAPLSVTTDLPSLDPIEALRALEGVDCAGGIEHARWVTVADLGVDPNFPHEAVAVVPGD